MKTINKILLFCLILGIVSCEDILEKDITDETAQIITPLNNEEVESNVVNFQWNGIDGADEYRIQVYGSNHAILLDSLVTVTHLTYPLAEGNYQWRVRGENFGYQSQYSLPASFSTVLSENLTDQHVVLLSPQNEVYVNFTNITLNWQSMPNATSYKLEAINITNGQQIYLNENVTGTSVTLNNPSLVDATYEWRVKAKNATTETLEYTARKFSLDRVNPNQPQNFSPATNSAQVINQQITFTWTIGADSGAIQSPITYSIEFSNDVNFTSPQTSDSSSATFQQSFGTAGTYYWRVKAKDKAGNTSVAGTSYKFTVN